MTNRLLEGICISALVCASGIGLIRSFHQNYDKGRPGIDYYLNGKPVIQRRFDSNEEFEEYLNSERGKWEQEYYSNLNEKD